MINTDKLLEHYRDAAEGRAGADRMAAGLSSVPKKPPATTLKCPECKAWAFDLWQMYGLTYYKCQHCGHKSQNL